MAIKLNYNLKFDFVFMGVNQKVQEVFESILQVICQLWNLEL